MPPAYYKGNSDEGIENFYTSIISAAPKIKIILYNFEKLSGFKFSENLVKKLVNKFPKNIIGPDLMPLNYLIHFILLPISFFFCNFFKLLLFSYKKIFVH